MARILQAAAFATEGEQRAAEALRELPDDWVVICNKTLVTRDARSYEIDFIILADHYVFVVDEKSWRGRIHGSDQVWVRADGSSERSPLGKIDYVANILASILRYEVPGLRERREHFVHGAVLLSITEEPPRLKDPRAADGVYLLDGLVERLVRFDERAEHEPIVGERSRIERVLLDFSDRPKFPKRINDFQIDEILSDRPGSYVARATHDLAGPRILSVYRLSGIEQATRELYLREFKAVQQLHATGLVPEVQDPFTWSEDYVVVPFSPPDGKTLASLKAPEGVEDFSAELILAATAFEALATIHEQGVIHRALSPDAVFVFGSARELRRVVFTGFHAARIPNAATVGARLDALLANDAYAAPELALSYGLAEPGSDVYSLALIFFERLSGLRPADIRTAEMTQVPHDQLTAGWSQLATEVLDELAQAFEWAFRPGPMGTADDPSVRRPTAAQFAARLRAIVRQLRSTSAEQSGRLLDGRYRVVRKLGEGGFGRTYLVEDEEMEPTVPRSFVVKVFHQPELVREQAGREFAALRGLSSPHLPRIYDFYPPQNDVHLKMDYVPGPTLQEVASELPWQESRWWRFADSLLSALESLEQHELRHRDLKPSNIILRTTDNHPVLVDFGLVVPTQTPAEPAGTIGYLPPEAHQASRPPESCDRYAASVILHETLFGMRPDEAPSVELSPRLEVIRAALLRATDQRPEARYLSAFELRQALEAARRIPDVDQPQPVECLRRINPWVDAVRGLYRGSATGNADNRGLDTNFALVTYVPTALDERLLPAILRERPPAVFLSGNPGDGKTAFLERVRQELVARGGARQQQDASGWEWTLDGHIFRSCYDASESHGGLSADEQLAQRLNGLEGGGPLDVPLTVLVAINDGRLADFFARHDETYPWVADGIRYADDRGIGKPDQPWVIDLKRRAFVDLADGQTSSPSVFQRVLSSLVAPERWEVCADCCAQAVCPMLANAKDLHGELDNGQARSRLERLATLTHLRHELHPTMRDLRSSIAYLVTANLSCEQVHHAREGVASADVLGAERRFWQRVFVPPEGADDLLLGMARLDPGRLSRPRLDRFLALHDAPEDQPAVVGLFGEADQAATLETARAHYADQASWLAGLKRRLYFLDQPREIDGLPVEPGEALPYCYGEVFLAALRGENDLEALKADLARGISRSDGIAADILGESLCVQVQHSDAQQLTVLKQFPLENFKLRVVRPPRSATIESIPEELEFVYGTGTPRLRIELDLFELLLRFAEGLRPTAPEYRPLLEDLFPFKNALILAATDELVLLEAERRVHRITQHDGKIVRMMAGEN